MTKELKENTNTVITKENREPLQKENTILKFILKITEIKILYKSSTVE